MQTLLLAPSSLVTVTYPTNSVLVPSLFVLGSGHLLIATLLAVLAVPFRVPEKLDVESVLVLGLYVRLALVYTVSAVANSLLLSTKEIYWTVFAVVDTVSTLDADPALTFVRSLEVIFL